MKNQVFIIGSGFSKDFDPSFPILSSLTNAILDYCEDPFIKNYIIDKIPKTLFQNTENLFSYLYSELPWKNPADIYINKGIFNALSIALSNYLVSLENKVVRPDHEPLKDIAEYWNRNRSTIVTFNYDTLIEKYLTQTYLKEIDLIDKNLTHSYIKQKDKSQFQKSLGLRFVRNSALPLQVQYDQSTHILNFNLPYNTTQRIPDNEEANFKEKFIACLPENEFKCDLIKVINSNLRSLFSLNKPVTEHQIYQCELVHLASRSGGALFGEAFEEIQTAKLYKLHGSINWYHTGSYDTASETIYYLPVESNNPNSKEATGLIPVIIPPLLQKDSYYANNVLKSQWQKLFRQFTDNNDSLELYFIGYSFPQTDFLAWSLFANLLPQNKPYKIFLVNCLCIEDGKFDKNSQRLIDYYSSTFLPKNSLSECAYSELIDRGFVERDGIIFDIRLSKIISSDKISWKKSDSTIQNLEDQLSKENKF